MDILKKAFSEVFREQRELSDLTQEELAFNAGVSRNFISLIETGQNIPAIPKLIKLAEELDTSADQILKKVLNNVKAAQKK